MNINLSVIIRSKNEERWIGHALQSVIDLVPNKAKERKVKKALSNSFGFGGTNASLVVGKLD